MRIGARGNHVAKGGGEGNEHGEFSLEHPHAMLVVVLPLALVLVAAQANPFTLAVAYKWPFGKSASGSKLHTSKSVRARLWPTSVHSAPEARARARRAMASPRGAHPVGLSLPSYRPRNLPVSTPLGK